MLAEEVLPVPADCPARANRRESRCGWCEDARMVVDGKLNLRRHWTGEVRCRECWPEEVYGPPPPPEVHMYETYEAFREACLSDWGVPAAK
jgi:hypothetical protein